MTDHETTASASNGGAAGDEQVQDRDELARPQHGSSSGRARFPAVAGVAVIVAAVVAGGLAADRRTPGTGGADALAAADLAPAAPGAGVDGSTWFCAGGTGRAGGAVHRVHVANVGDEPVGATITVVPGAGRGEAVTARPATESLEVEPGASETVVLADVVDAPFLAAVIEVGAGQVAVEHSISASADGSTGANATPCASTATATAHFAAGTTTRGSLEQLVLFNPFADDTVVDVSFATADGLREPEAFDGLIIPARRVLAIDVGSVISRYPNVSTSIVARTGRFVADRIQRFDGSDGPAGLALTGAARVPALVWHVPDGSFDEGVDEVVTVYNPTERQAEVDVEVALDASDDPAEPAAAEPFQLSIAPFQFAQVTLSDDDRVPRGRGHRFTVRSQNGVAVVAERWLRIAADASGPALVASMASPVVATRWLAATGATDGGTQRLVIANPSVSAVARVAISSPSAAGAAGLAGLGEVQIAPSSRVTISLDEALGDDPLVLIVQSDVPVVVERATRTLPGGGDGGDEPSGDGAGEQGRSIILPVASSASVPDVEPGEPPTGPLPTVVPTSTSSTNTTSTSTTSTTSTTTAPSPTTTTAPP